VWLEFDGVNHEADVWLDGTNVGTLTYPFARAAFDVTGILDGGEGQHVLAVRITPLPHPGSPGDKANGVSFVNSYELELDAPTYACASGAGPRPAGASRVTTIRSVDILVSDCFWCSVGDYEIIRFTSGPVLITLV
jgi:glycosyl hydrolase family 2